MSCQRESSSRPTFCYSFVMHDHPEDLPGVAITWKHTGDAEFPYTTEVGGKTYTIRINDFPAEPLYTVLSEGVELMDLEDWPPAWLMPTPPKQLLDMLAKTIGPRSELADVDARVGG